MLCRRSTELIALLALATGNAWAQPLEPPKTCEAKEFRQLDFWVGEWRVTWKTPQGQPADARNSVRLVLAGCAVEEHWRGGDGSESKSLTFFDPATKRWHQTLIDNTAQPLFLDGNVEGESLVLTGRSGTGFRETFHRVTWTPRSDGLRQHWEQSPDGKAWTTVFDGRYARVSGK